MTTLQNINLDTASLNQLLCIATASMIAEAEEVATAAMAKISEPACGAREIVIASYLRARLASERAHHENFMAKLADLLA